MANQLPSALDIPENQPFGKPVLDAAFTYIVNRFLAIESFKPSYQAAIDTLNSVGLNRINSAIQPIYDNLASFGQLGAIFSTTSTTTVTVTNNVTVNFTIASADAPAFAAAAYIGVQHRGDATTYMSGRTLSYDRNTGTLSLAIDNIGGSGTYSDWIISASVEPPTSLDVGAALTAQLNSFQTTVNGQFATFQQGVNAQVGALAPAASPVFTGNPTTVDPGTNDNSSSIPTTRWVQTLIKAVNNAIASVQNAVGTPIRADATQTLTTQQQLQARTNAGSAAQGANTDITSITGLKSLSCTGAATFGGVVTGAGIVGTAATGPGQVVAKNGNFAMGLFADGGTQAYLMATAAGNATGGFSGFRPFSWNVSNGVVSIAADGAATNTGGSLTVGSTLIANGNVNFPNARPTWAGQTPYDTGNFNPATKMNIDGGATVVGYNGGNTNRPYISGNVYHDLVWANTNDVRAIGLDGFANPYLYAPDSGTVVVACRSSGDHRYNWRWNGSTAVFGVDNSEFGMQLASDSRLKTVDGPVKREDATNKLLALDPVVYEYNDKFELLSLRPGKRYGFIAQDLEKILPTSVQAGAPHNQEDCSDHASAEPYLLLTPDAAIQICALLVKSNQEMAARITALEAKLS